MDRQGGTNYLHLFMQYYLRVEGYDAYFIQVLTLSPLIMLGKYMASVLKGLIDKNQIKQIKIYGFVDSKLYRQSKNWIFNGGFIQIGSEPYDLKRVAAFQVVDQALHLYF